MHYAGRGVPASSEHPHPADASQYAIHGRKLNLVLCFRDPDGNMDAWKEFVRLKIRTHAEHLANVSVTLEPNLALPNMTMDGNFPAILPALVQGIAAAREEIDHSHLSVKAGFCTSPTFGPKASFWSDLAQAGGKSFIAALDYVGVDFYADVFFPVAPEDLRGAVLHHLRQFREVDLAAAGISPSVPIQICENGWPTSSSRTPERQARVLEELIRTIHEAREEFNITHYQWFSLRDSDSGRDEIFSQFGLMRDDYTPKPAFDMYRKVIAVLG